MASLTALPSHPLRARRRQVFSGPGFRNGSTTCPSFHHSLLATAERWYVLHVQSLASVRNEPAGPDASPPSYSPAPLELRHRATLRATTFQSPSGGLRPFGTSQACRSRHRFSPLELPLPVYSCARYQYVRQLRFPTPQRCSPIASVPLSPNLCAGAVDGLESSGGGCSPPLRNEFAVKAVALNTNTGAPLHAAPAQLRARGFRSPPQVECQRRGSRESEHRGASPRSIRWHVCWSLDQLQHLGVRALQHRICNV